MPLQNVSINSTHFFLNQRAETYKRVSALGVFSRKTRFSRPYPIGPKEKDKGEKIDIYV